MKRTTLLFTLLLSISIGLLAQTTITNPFYEFTISGITNVSKIELTDSATYVTIHSTFIPKWWVTFSDETVISDSETGREFKVLAIKGTSFNKRLRMPASGDSSIVLVFPPLPASVKKIDYNKTIFGISLNSKQAGVKQASSIDPEIDQWIEAELAKATTKPLNDFQSSEFFNDTPARLIGCIKGYDTRSGFSTGISYASNELTNDDFPVVAQIQPNGSFELEIPLNTPKQTTIYFNDHWSIDFYIEPGQTLAMILDWDEFLEADRRRNIRHQFKQIEFRGALSTLNHELLSYSVPQPNYKVFDQKISNMTPMEFKTDQENELEENLTKLNNYLKNNSLSVKAQILLHNTITINNATYLFDFTMRRDYSAKQDTANEILKLPVADSYYDFLKRIDMNDQSILAVKPFGTFINRFEYCDLFRKAQSIVHEKSKQTKVQPEKTLLDYFIEEQIELSEEEHELLKLWGKGQLSNEERALQKEKEELNRKFNEKHKGKINEWASKYITQIYSKENESREIELWKAKDSILIHNMGLENSLVYEVAKVRSLKFFFNKAASKEIANMHWSQLKQGINTPFLILSGDKLLSESFPDVVIAATPLPDGIGADVFRKLIEPHKGKLLFVDFWATTCGPCLSGIRKTKDIREKYANNPDFDFVFITDERGSPEKTYNDLVEEQEMMNTYRISKDDFNHLRQLFKFNGIPRYVVIDANGNVVDDHFSMYNFESELAKLLPEYKN